MWNGIFTVFVAFVVVGSTADDDPSVERSIEFRDMKLIGSDGKDTCLQDCDSTVCVLKQGDSAKLQAVVVINGGKYTHVGLTSFLTTIKWGLKSLPPVVVKAQTCQTTGSPVRIGGVCGTTLMAEGTYKLIPYTIQIPTNNNSQINTELSVIASSVRWTDKQNRFKNVLIGQIKVVIQ